jgi:hypothetical protein
MDHVYEFRCSTCSGTKLATVSPLNLQRLAEIEREGLPCSACPNGWSNSVEIEFRASPPLRYDV